MSSSCSKSRSQPCSQPSLSGLSWRIGGGCSGGELGATAVVPQTVRGATGLVEGEAREAKDDPPGLLVDEYGGENEALLPCVGEAAASWMSSDDMA